MNKAELSSLTNQQLVNSIEKSARQERSNTTEILDKLAEMDRRKIHLELGFRSLHSYCVSRLRYSESAAGRRICTARAIVKCPEIREMISDGRLNLSTVCVLSSVLNQENRLDLLKQASGKSRREVEAMVGRMKPRKKMRERITPVTIEEISPEQADHTEPSRFASLDDLPDFPEDSTNSNKCKNINLRRGGKIPTTPTSQESPADLRQDRFELRFSVKQEKMIMLERARKIAPGSSTLESVFGRMLREYLERHDPAMKQERREKRKERALKRNETARSCEPKGEPGRDGVTGSSEVADKSRNSNCNPPRESRSRHIPTPLRDEVLLRDGHRCTFVSPDGTRCDATRHLQIDHITPFALGGQHEAGNLRLLCGPHNRLEAERIGLIPPEQRVEWLLQVMNSRCRS